MFEQSGNFHFINLTSRHERGAAVNTALSFYIAIPANTPLWFVVLFHHHYMYRTLANPKMFRRLTHRRIIINNISGYFHSSFLNIGFHKNSPAILVFTLYAGELYTILSNIYCSSSCCAACCC